MSFPAAYGSFSSSATQNLTSGSSTLMTYDTTDIVGGGVSLVGNSIRVPGAGIYRIAVHDSGKQNQCWNWTHHFLHDTEREVLLLRQACPSQSIKVLSKSLTSENSGLLC